LFADNPSTSQLYMAMACNANRTLRQSCIQFAMPSAPLSGSPAFAGMAVQITSGLELNQ
jgi:hypothetical protein